MSTGYSRAGQREILRHLLCHPPYFPLVKEGTVLPQDFSSFDHSVILETVLYIFDGLETLPTEAVPEDLLMRWIADRIRGGDLELSSHEVRALTNEIYEVYECGFNPSFVTEGVIYSFVKEVRAAKIIDRRERGDISASEAADLLSDLSASLVVGGGRNMDVPLYDLDEIAEGTLIDLLPGECDAITTGIPSLDARLNGGLLRGATGLIVAYTGVGKSVMSTCLSWGAASAGHPVLIYSTELTPKMFLYRLLSCGMSISYSGIRHGTVGLSREEVNRRIAAHFRRAIAESPAFRQAMSNIRIVCRPESTPEQLRVEAEQANEHFLEKSGLGLSLVVVDWLDRMVPNQARVKKEHRLNLAEISQQIDNIAKDRDLGIWMTTQANDKAADKDRVGMEAIGEARAKAHPVSVVMGLGIRDQQRTSDGDSIYTINCPKNREGAVFVMKVRGELDYQRFVDYDEEEDGDPSSFSELGNRRTQL